MNKNTFIPLFLLPTLVHFSCGVNKYELQTEVEQVELHANQIVFFIFRIDKNADTDKNQIKLLNTIRKVGLVKKDLKSGITSVNILTIRVYYNNQIIETIQMNHPLYKEIEYFHESNVINKKNIESNSEDFSIRLQIKNSNSIIKIFETLKNQPERELISQKI